MRSHKKILYARQTDQRVATYRKAFAVGLEYARDTKVRRLAWRAVCLSMDRFPCVSVSVYVCMCACVCFVVVLVLSVSVECTCACLYV